MSEQFFLGSQVVVTRAIAGASAAIPFGFSALGSTDNVKVSVDDTTLTAGQYSVALNAGGIGGTVTILTSPANGAKITIWLDLSDSRQTAPNNYDTLNAQILNAEFNHQLGLTQILQERLSRAVLLPQSSGSPPPVFKATPDEGKILAWGADGGIVNTTVSFSEITALQDTANASADAATTSATNAKNSETATANSATAAQVSAETASTKADEANASAESASNSATEAVSSLSEAVASAEASANSANLAGTFETAVAGHAEDAQMEANRAVTAASEANTEANRALTEANRSSNEADRAEAGGDTAITEANRISAQMLTVIEAGTAANTEATRAEGEANRALTEANRSSNEADRANTEADRAATEADRALSVVSEGILDNSVTLAKLDTAVSSSLLSTGSVVAFSSEVVPEGWLECDGSTLSRTAYADLFAVIGTTFGWMTPTSTNFKIPDLRARFIRGWDHGQRVDMQRYDGEQLSRRLGTLQGDGIKHHRHIGGAAYTPDVLDKQTYHGIHGEMVQFEELISEPTSETSSHVARFYTSYYGGENDTRPMNVAFMYCIKY